MTFKLLYSCLVLLDYNGIIENMFIDGWEVVYSFDIRRNVELYLLRWLWSWYNTI